MVTEEELSSLIDMSVDKIVKYIDEGRLPGVRVGPQGSRVRTLTSVRELIEFAEGKWEKSGVGEIGVSDEAVQV